MGTVVAHVLHLELLTAVAFLLLVIQLHTTPINVQQRTTTRSVQRTRQTYCFMLGTGRLVHEFVACGAATSMVSAWDADNTPRTT